MKSWTKSSSEAYTENPVDFIVIASEIWQLFFDRIVNFRLLI